MSNTVVSNTIVSVKAAFGLPRRVRTQVALLPVASGVQGMTLPASAAAALVANPGSPPWSPPV